MCERDLSGGQHQAQAEVIHANVVADGVKVLHALLDQRADQVLGNAAQPEASDHKRVAIFDVVHGLVCIRNYLVHCHRILIPTGDCTGACRLDAKRSIVHEFCAARSHQVAFQVAPTWLEQTHIEFCSLLIQLVLVQRLTQNSCDVRCEAQHTEGWEL